MDNESDNLTGEVNPTTLGEERLRLEREALAVERERLQAARARAEAEAAMDLRQHHHPFLVTASVTMLGLLCFAAGLLSGITIMENRQENQRRARLAQALSQLDTLSESSTNSIALPVPLDGKSPKGAHRNVAVMVIQ